MTLKDDLVRDPQAHHLFLALRILEAAHADRPRLGTALRPRQDAIRLGQEPELAFPPTSILSLETDGQGHERLTNRFFGLFGPHGPLPLHLTEFARNRMRNDHDRTFVAFADMFTHRLATLLYRAWTTGQPAPSLDRAGSDTFGDKVAALSGHLGRELAGRDPMPDMAKRYFAGHLAQGAKNPEGLLAILSSFFSATVTLTEFVGTWLVLEPQDRWRLGARAGLGRATSIGNRVWTRAAKFRLRIGPVSLADYERLLPGGASMERLKAIVRNYAGDAFEWDVNLVLRHDQVPAPVLGASARLGQTTWIGTRSPGRDADDLCVAAG